MPLLGSDTRVARHRRLPVWHLPVSNRTVCPQCYQALCPVLQQRLPGACARYPTVVVQEIRFWSATHTVAYCAFHHPSDTFRSINDNPLKCSLLRLCPHTKIHKYAHASHEPSIYSTLRSAMLKRKDWIKKESNTIVNNVQTVQSRMILSFNSPRGGEGGGGSHENNLSDRLLPRLGPQVILDVAV